MVSFNGLQPQQYVVTIHSPGYIDIRENVNLSTMSTGYINARLILDRASIQANRANIISSSPSVIDASVPAEAKTLHLNAKLPDAQLLAGNLLLKAGRGKDALGYFEEYLKLEPKGEFAEQTQTLVKKIRKSLAEEKK